MRKLVVTCLLISLGLGNVTVESKPAPASSADLTPKTGTDSEELIPLKVKCYIDENFPGWRIAGRADYHKLWWSFYEKDHHPSGVVADFNDDKLVDFVLILKKLDEIKLVFLLGAGDSFTHQLAEDFQQTYGKGNELEVGLHTEPPGRIDVVYPEEKSLILKSNGIAIMDFEVKTRIYYWADGAFRVFQMKPQKAGAHL